MTRYTILAAPLAGLTTPAPALADSAETWRDGFGHMWGGGFSMVGGVMMLLFWGGIILLIALAVRGFSGGSEARRGPDAREILRERYARGDIDEEEYERRKAGLET